MVAASRGWQGRCTAIIPKTNLFSIVLIVLEQWVTPHRCSQAAVLHPCIYVYQRIKIKMNDSSSLLNHHASIKFRLTRGCIGSVAESIQCWVVIHKMLYDWSCEAFLHRSLHLLHFSSQHPCYLPCLGRVSLVKEQSLKIQLQLYLNTIIPRINVQIVS